MSLARRRSRGRGPDAVGVGRGAQPHVAQLLHEHVHVLRAGLLEDELSAGHAQGGEERRRLEPVGDHLVVDRVERRHPVDGDGAGPGAQDVGPHPVEEGGQVGQLGLLGRVLDDGGALGQHRGHQRVLGRPDARELQDDPCPAQAVGPGLDEAVLGVELDAEAAQRAQVPVDGALAEVVASGHRHLGPAQAGHERAEDHDRGPHGLHQLVGGLGHRVGRRVDGEDVTIEAHLRAHGPQQVRHAAVTSVMAGTLRMVNRPSQRSVAAISLSTEFLAPEIDTRPSRGPLPRTMIRSTGPAWQATGGGRPPTAGQAPPWPADAVERGAGPACA